MILLSWYSLSPSSYLLDDPLSAVDAHVGKALFRNCIRGELCSKCVILVTHALEYLSACDQIVILHEGQIQDQGDYTHVTSLTDGVLAGLLKAQAQAHAQNAQNAQNAQSDQSLSSLSPTIPTSPTSSATDEKNENETANNTDSSTTSSSITTTPSSSTTPSTTTVAKAGELITTETHITGTVKKSVYSLYFNAIGNSWRIAIIILLFFLSQAVRAINTWWLTVWSNNQVNHSNLWYAGIYCVLGICSILTAMLAPFILYLTSLRASKSLHDGLLHGIMHSPTSFFDQTPLGRITNRLSKDLYTVDRSLPSIFDSFLSCLFTVLATIFVISIANPWFLVVLVPLSCYYLYEQQFYVHSSREIKRLDSISRSPIYANFGETLDGASVIRAYQAEEQFICKDYDLVDCNQRAYFIISSSNCWLGIRLEFAGTIIIGAAVLLSILRKNPLDSVFTVMAAMAITYSLDTTQDLNWLVRMATDLETQIVSVERIQEYTDLPSEAPSHIPDHTPEKGWPTKGDIVIQDMSMRYRPELEPVLKHLSLHIQPGEKIGVVGRTGAGKSSLVLCLMRIVEMETGHIFIDDVDISKIGLEDLRSSISIIPQEPILFSGTIRSNLDPFNKYSDEDIWSALDRTFMRDSISSTAQGLETPVEEHGNNYSVGQRQLICIARALLRKSKVILMDEATASIDVETDRNIQTTIKSQFADSTVITIAHRIHTIIESDRVLVLEQGEVQEYDKPQTLLQNPVTLFSQLVEKSKEVE